MPAQRTPPTFYVSTDVPPLLIRMLWQIDVGNEPFRTLTWSEEVPPRAQMKPRQIHRASVLERYSGLIPSSRPNAIIHSNAHAVQLIGASTNTSAGQQKLLPLTDLGVSSPEEESDDGEEKIKKPSGEVGRPGRGGYNLEVALGWARDDFEKIKESEASSMIKHLTSIQAYVHRLAADHLDMSKALSFQRKEAIDVVCCKASNRFPSLNRYTNYWPIRDILHLHLKYTSSRDRHLILEQKAGRNALKKIREKNEGGLQNVPRGSV